MAESAPHVPLAKPLDESLYDLNEEEIAFFKSQTGINDEQALKEHIIKAQSEAYKVYPYSCIRSFAFTKLKISRLPAYPQLLKLGRERENAILLDIGCCFGNDVCKAIADGYPRNSCIASDLEPDFWKLGQRLFNTSSDAFQVPFVPGDAFDPAFIKPIAPFNTIPENPLPRLSELTSLIPLLGHVSAIHASSFFHLFDEAKQLQLARSLAGLLSPQPGSLILGVHGGRLEKGLRVEQGRPSVRGSFMFCHSPASWKEMWDGEVFKKGTVRVEAEVMETQRSDMSAVQPGTKFYSIIWSVTRL